MSAFYYLTDFPEVIEEKVSHLLRDLLFIEQYIIKYKSAKIKQERPQGQIRELDCNTN